MSDSLADRLDGIVHADTQVAERGVDLTVAEIRSVDEPGRIDFGGGELTDAASSPVETEKRNSEDDYGWWNLEEGTYLLSYNETLTEGDPLVLQPRTELRERGGSHPTLFTDSVGTVPLSVPTGGLRLKENARVSTLLEPP
ncbi:deoxycytidine triphosphate deaminase [Halogeometricum pallidum JCM 14848]|uniref:Deoxycytidine triphosphate deaminase n=1 Tax=Halogeometricum pallidum JCM 14848 TaxID=1227487 RepID=M0DH84_HALPD|nr:deoxycytidine triphosphate deaminase [Halogeometricum pallidum]ELZ34871.1 deoxycytidine triphosphate deaminase [Halogeometricum pallidum JCM 14848]